MKNKIALLFASSIAATIAITILSSMAIAPEIFQLQIPETTLGVTPDGTFYWPRDVAVNSTDYIFVADTQNSRGQIFDSSGNFVTTFGFPGNNVDDGSMNQPYGIYINSTDFVHIADTFTNVLKVYDSNGEYLYTIGTAGTGTGEYYYPSGMTGNSTHFIIADSYNNRIVITNHTGITEDTIP